MQLRPRVVEVLRRHDLLARGAHLLVATSGGLDSTVCAHVLADVAERWQLELTFAYIHHGLRAEADDERVFVAQLAGHLGAAFVTSSVDVSADVAATGDSTQHVARRLRYEALETLRREAGASCIITAHHADDQAETLLLRFLRGAGPAALAGIRERSGAVVRPLLGVTRDNLVAYARAHRIVWREDASNAGDAYLRNALRHHVVPAITTHVNPGLARTLVRQARLHEALGAYLDDESRRLSAACVHTDRSGVSLAVEALSRYFSFQRFLVYRHAVAQHFGLDLPLADVERIDALVGARSGSCAMLAARLFAVRTRDALVVERRHDAADFSVQLEPGDEIVVPDGGMVRSTQLPPEESAHTAAGVAEVVDADRARPPWRLRTVRRGDRMIPLGMTGHRAVHDLLAEAGVPRHRRAASLVLEHDDGIFWLVGVRIAAHVRCTDATTRRLRLAYEPAFQE
jgi:tRNA(Ile)-lysidine synthase